MALKPRVYRSKSNFYSCCKINKELKNKGKPKMAVLKDKILELLKKNDGLSDREIADVVLGKGSLPQRINQVCRKLAGQGLIVRTEVEGQIKNYLGTSFVSSQDPGQPRIEIIQNYSDLSEDALKIQLEKWLKSDGWSVEIAWGHTQGIDICASRGRQRWIIEVKGKGSRPAMRVNYFLAILGEILQRMDDPEAIYSIALPDLQQFRNLWRRLPILVKQRMGITALFISQDGSITFCQE